MANSVTSCPALPNASHIFMTWTERDSGEGNDAPEK
jgi:hypothetical protein